MAQSSSARRAPEFQAEYTGTHAQNVRTVTSGFWRTVSRSIGKFTFIRDAIAMYYCAMDDETPGYVQGGLFAALAYFVLPIDFVADAIPLLGMADDAAVISAALYCFGNHIKDEHRQAAADVISSQLSRFVAPSARESSLA